MNTPDLSDPRSRRRVVAVLAAAVAVLTLTVVGVYGLLTGPPSYDRDDDRPPRPVVTAPADPVPTTTTPRLPTVAASDDPESFARNVAETLFAWDTASGL